MRASKKIWKFFQIAKQGTNHSCLFIWLWLPEPSLAG
jgi:hypothetical protein